ncbi:MAG: hypothetical protein RR521_09890 [Clostridia bacterium]
MLKTLYQQMIDQVKPNPTLVQAVVLQAQRTAQAPSPPAHRRSAWILALALVCSMAAFTALASSSDTVYQWLYQLSPAIAQHLKPIQLSCEDNGIRMTVAAAYIHESCAEIIITVQDLQANRIDETIDLFDSYSINRPFDGSGTCEFLSYDDATKTATFHIQLQEANNHPITGSKITFSVCQFISHKANLTAVSVPLALNGLDEAPTQLVRLSGWGGDDSHVFRQSRDRNAYPVLVPQGELAPLADSITLSAIGYINGQLHVQMATRNKLQNDNHGELYLLDKAGNRIACSYLVNFVENAHVESVIDGASYSTDLGITPQRVDFSEFVFDVSPQTLQDARLYGDFTLSSMLTAGDWQVTFPLVAE